MDYEITVEASKDLESIWDYTEETWSLSQADRYVNLIIDEFERLCIFPMSGKDCETSGIPYRMAKIKSHLIFYKINSAETLTIVRVLHENMEYLEVLRS
jgi:toxin ParE1/3/4